MTDKRAATANRIDLDAARAARREKAGPPPEVHFLGRDWPLPRALPARVIELVGSVTQGDYTAVIDAMKTLLGGPVYEELAEAATAAGDPLELEDVTFLLEQVLEIYGVTAPKSGASGSS